MTRKIFVVLLAFTIGYGAQAQDPAYLHTGDWGLTLGAAHYFGDLNTRVGLQSPKPALGVFYRKQYGLYVALRVSAHYARLGYSDSKSKNDYQKTRNLSFNTSVFEAAVQGDFNFFKYTPNNAENIFTPYITLGVGIFNYDPYAFLAGEKVYLRPLGTEGQVANYLGRKAYSNLAVCIPFGVGVKYSLSEKINLSFEVAQRFTNTDYLDDVSTTYAGADKFPNKNNGQPSNAALLQDRSYEVVPNNILGIEGRQRGNAKQKDQYVIAEFGISFNLSAYRCPRSN